MGHLIHPIIIIFFVSVIQGWLSASFPEGVARGSTTSHSFSEWVLTMVSTGDGVIVNWNGTVKNLQLHLPAS